MKFSIVSMLADHWPTVREIYCEGIASGNATFEFEAPDWERWDAAHRKDCRLVAVDEKTQSASANKQRVFGWAALGPVSARQVYRGVAEVSIYVAAATRREGIGKALLAALILKSEAAGIWTLQAGIFPENLASISLHKTCGFREVGVRRNIGKLKDTWREVVLLERRSSVAGI